MLLSNKVISQVKLTTPEIKVVLFGVVCPEASK
jgi:hypothetical protein